MCQLAANFVEHIHRWGTSYVFLALLRVHDSLMIVIKITLEVDFQIYYYV